MKQKQKTEKNTFDPDTRDFKFLKKKLQVLEILCRAQKKFFLKCPEKNSVQFFWALQKMSIT